MSARHTPGRATTVVALAVVLVAAGCRGRAQAPAQQPARVTAYAVEARDVSVPREFVGQVAAVSQVSLVARVSGYLEAQAFRDGSRVRAGDLLFRIDPLPFRAALDQARAQLAQTESALSKAERDVARYTPLARDNAVPRQTLDDAVSARRSAAANVQAQRAAVETARLALGYTEVRSPVDGRIGRAQVYPGALVNAGQTVLATVSTIDPADAYFSVSELDYLGMAALLGDPARASRVETELLLADGSAYRHPGRIDFMDRAMASQTGSLPFRARFPNPDELLRPGMFARVRVLERLDGAILVPSRAVVQVLSSSSVVRVGKGDVAETRQVELGPQLGAYQVVRSGLAPGDRVVVDGVGQVRPGTNLAVTPTHDAGLASGGSPAPPSVPGAAPAAPAAAPVPPGGTVAEGGVPGAPRAHANP